MRRSLRTLWFALCICSPWAHPDTETTVYAPVTRVEPVLSATAITADPLCTTPKPRAVEGLATLLAWELATCVVARPSISHYRVFYQWDGRTYSQLMTRRPDHSVPLILKIR